jgi:hypothetical protein
VPRENRVSVVFAKDLALLAGRLALYCSFLGRGVPASGSRDRERGHGFCLFVILEALDHRGFVIRGEVRARHAAPQQEC